AAPRHRRRLRGTVDPEQRLMRVRRHFGPIQELKFDARLWRWVGIGAGMVLAGYLTAYLILFRVPILPGHHAVPREVGITVAGAQAEIQKAKLQVTDGGAEPHPTAPAGVVVWQDPPPDVVAPEGTKIVLVSSAGPPKIPVPAAGKPDPGPARRPVFPRGRGGGRGDRGQAAPDPRPVPG